MDDKPTTLIKHSLKFYIFSQSFIIDVLSNIVVVKTLGNLNLYFNEWKELVEFLVPVLKDKPTYFDDFETTN